ncbi:hypothetical protein [Humidisolicoccus flavus]|uniref:hypothetical protein n=1 Tax=Humidisolicoccus flavus TaxID=3111414 RepID=UPI003250ACAC
MTEAESFTRKEIGRRSFLRVAAASLILGGTTFMFDQPAYAAGYGYDYSFSLKGTGGAAWKPQSKSGAAMFAYVKPRLSALFPLEGMINNPTVGRVLQLRSKPIERSNPVKVMAVGATSFQLKSLPRHLEGANNYITFSFTGTTMRVFATGPKAADFPGSWVPLPLWTKFARSISTSLYVPGTSVPHRALVDE